MSNKTITRIFLLSIIVLTLLVGLNMFENKSNCPKNFVEYKSNTLRVCVPQRLKLADSHKEFSSYFNDETISASFQNQSQTEFLSFYKNGTLDWIEGACDETSKVNFLGQESTILIDKENLSNSNYFDKDPICGKITQISLFGEGKWAIIWNYNEANIDEFNLIWNSLKISK